MVRIKRIVRSLFFGLFFFALGAFFATVFIGPIDNAFLSAQDLLQFQPVPSASTTEHAASGDQLQLREVEDEEKDEEAESDVATKGHSPVIEAFRLEREFGILRQQTPGIKTYPTAKASPIESLNIHNATAREPWKKFQNGITKLRLYDPNDRNIEKLIFDLQTLPILSATEPLTGTQLKLFMNFSNGGGAMFKPMRQNRQEARRGINQFYFSEYERHNAEIAAYHLDRVIGFHRVPPTVGRIFNIGRDIYATVDEYFNRTIFISPRGNKCFNGHCVYYCDTGHAVCGSPDLVEGSLQALVPMNFTSPRKNFLSPWRRSYNRNFKAKWEVDPNYCRPVIPHFGKTRAFLDLIDLYIFDFIADNLDRHHMDQFLEFGEESAPVVFDNGRCFGEPDYDEMTILYPLTQCCRIRYSTLQKLLKFVFGPKKLSEAFVASSKSDIVYPLLTENFHEAMDRRLVITLREVRKCVEQFNFTTVVWDDGY